MPERGWPIVCLAVATIMIGTSLAAPKNNDRLYIAPALLVVIAGVSAIDRMWETAAVRELATAGALVVHLGFIALSAVLQGQPRLHRRPVGR